MATQSLYRTAWISGRAERHGDTTMADREGQERGGPGEMESDGISPVVGDLERTTTAPPRPGQEIGWPEGNDLETLAGTVMQALRDLKYPLTRDDLVREAAGRGVPGELLDPLTRLPDRVYESAEDVAGEMQRSR